MYVANHLFYYYFFQVRTPFRTYGFAHIENNCIIFGVGKTGKNSQAQTIHFYFNRNINNSLFNCYVQNYEIQQFLQDVYSDFQYKSFQRIYQGL